MALRGFSGTAVGVGSILVCSVGLPAACWPAAGGNVITGTQNWQIVSRLTGPNQTGHVGVGGTDLGHMVNHNGKTYFLFGDTFATEAPAGSGGPDWRNNVMARTTDRNPADGITFDGWITRPNGTARQVISPGTQPVTYIPTGAISVGDRIYSWYMHVSDWNGWTLSHAGLASWQEGQSQFSIVPDFAFPGSTDEGRQGGNFGMVAASYRSPLENVNDPHIYLWGTGGGRLGGVKLARVMPDQIENQAAYQYFNGEVNGVPQWTDNEFEAPHIIDDTVGEMSVMYNQALGAWTLMYQNGENLNFEIRQSDTPWGNWSEPTTVTRFNQAPGLYAPYMNPLYVEDDGRTLYFTMSLWDPYDVYLAKVDLDIDLQTRWSGAAGDWAGAHWTHGSPNAQRLAVLDNGGTVRLNTLASARGFDVGTRPGAGGTLEIHDGGDLTIHDGGFRLGLAEGAAGHLVMTGGSVDITGGYNMFLVGDHGDATADISGGSITARTFGIGLQPTSNAHVNFGGDAVLTTTGDRFVMAMFRNPAAGAAPRASMNMTGGTINVTAGASGIPDAVIGFDGRAELTMSGGSFNVEGLFVSAVAGAAGGLPASTATIRHTGGSINTQRMVLGENGLSHYTLSGTGAVNVDRRLTLGWHASSGSTLVQSGGTINVDLAGGAPNGVGLLIGDAGEARYTIHGGVLNVPRHLHIAGAAGSLGQMTVAGGEVNVGRNLLVGVGGSGLLTQTGGTLSVGTLRPGAGGAFHFNGGTLHVETFDGHLTNHAGTLAPGRPLGVTRATRVTGDYTQGSGATLALDIGGLSPGSGHDRLIVDGAANLAGVLSLGLVDGFSPAYGDRFTLLTAAELEGEFGRINGVLPGLSASGEALGMAVFYDPQDVFLLATLPGDANGDLSVDFTDFLALRGGFGSSGTWSDGDFTGDGVIDFADFLLLRSHFGRAADGNGDASGYGAVVAFGRTIPEPAGGTVCLGVAGLLGLRRRR